VLKVFAIKNKAEIGARLAGRISNL